MARGIMIRSGNFKLNQHHGITSSRAIMIMITLMLTDSVSEAARTRRP
jgi:hypothetical protein